MSNKEYFLEGFAQRTAYCNSYKEHTDYKACCKGIYRPEYKVVKAEGYIYHKLAKEGYGTGCQHSSPCNVKISAPYVFHKGDDSNNKDSNSSCNGEGKCQKPISVSFEVDIKEISDDCHKVDGGKNNGIRSLEPYRKDNDDISQCQCQHNIS